MFSFAVKHISDTVGTGFTASRAVGNPGLSGAGMKPVLKKYGIRTSYTVDEANGSEPYEVETVFPNGTYSALDYTPVRSGYKFVGWSRGEQLPYDAELEWIRNPITGGSKNGFSIGVIPNANDTSFEVSFDTDHEIARDYGEVRNNVDQTINGVRRGIGFTAYRNTGSSFVVNNTSLATKSNDGLGYPVKFSYDCTTYTIKRESPNQATATATVPLEERDFTYTINFTLFKCFNNTSSRSTPMMLHYLKIWKNGVLVRDLIPVRVGLRGYLYDKANPSGGPSGNGLYTNTAGANLLPGPGAPHVDVDPSDNVPFTPHTIYAVWQYPLSVTFDATTKGGEMPSEWVAPNYYEGQPYGTLPVPVKSGSVFTGWFRDGLHITSSSKAAYSSNAIVARYAVPTYDTSFEVTTTSSYRKAGIYAANSRNLANPTIVDWGDGSTSVVYGNVSQLVHTYSSNGTFTVKVNNNISSFALSANNSTWYQTTTNNRYVVKKVTAIGSNVTSIPTYAFNYCSAMTDAVLPTTISSAPNYCFYYCSALKGITIPSNYTSIGSYAFYRCQSSSFTSVTIPAAITTINAYAFNYCNHLHPVFEASTSTLTLGNYAFSQCGSQGSSFTIDMSMRKVTSIPNNCFQYCRYLSGFVWPQGVTSVGQSAFQYCFMHASSTGTLEVPEGITSTGNYAFANCLYLTAITLPSTLSNMNNNSLRGSTIMTTITVNRSTAPTVGNSTFGAGTNDYTGRNSYSAGTNKLYVPAGATGYTSSYWGSVLLDSTKCGFTKEEMQ